MKPAECLILGTRKEHLRCSSVGWTSLALPLPWKSFTAAAKPILKSKLKHCSSWLRICLRIQEAAYSGPFHLFPPLFLQRFSTFSYSGLSVSRQLWVRVALCTPCWCPISETSAGCPSCFQSLLKFSLLRKSGHLLGSDRSSLWLSRCSVSITSAAFCPYSPLACVAFSAFPCWLWQGWLFRVDKDFTLVRSKPGIPCGREASPSA